MIIQLEDGFNGKTMNFESFPLMIDGDCIKVKCSDDGKGYLIKWVHRNDYNKAVLKAIGLI